jgi:transposase InsO family protein
MWLTSGGRPEAHWRLCRLSPPLERRGIKHLRTQDYGPRTKAKFERFRKTMAREWGYGMPYSSHHHRNRALPHWLDYYNQHRPHSSLGGLPPIGRVHNVFGQDI